MVKKAERRSGPTTTDQCGQNPALKRTGEHHSFARTLPSEVALVPLSPLSPTRFIQKQGLDRTFIECDNHMWRVDNRELPPDITLDGGSDWIAINRNYSHYLVTNKDPFLAGLKRYYEFSLLPAEVRRLPIHRLGHG